MNDRERCEADFEIAHNICSRALGHPPFPPLIEAVAHAISEARKDGARRSERNAWHNRLKRSG